MWSVLRRQTWIVAPRVIAPVLLMLAAPPAGAQADLAVSATWEPNCDPCRAGQRLTFVNTVTNQGPSPDPSVHIQMATAALGTTPVTDSWTTTQGEYTADDEGNILFTDDTGLAYLLLAEMGVMTPSSTATLTFEVDLDMEPPPVSDLTVNSPPDLAGRWQHRDAAFGHNDPDCCHFEDPDFPSCCDPATSDNVLYLHVDVVPAEPSAGFLYEPARTTPVTRPPPATGRTSACSTVPVRRSP